MQIIYFSNLDDKYIFFLFFSKKKTLICFTEKIVFTYKIIIVQCISPPHHTMTWVIIMCYHAPRIPHHSNASRQRTAITTRMAGNSSAGCAVRVGAVVALVP